MSHGTLKINILDNFDMLVTFFAKHVHSAKRIASTDFQDHSGLSRRASQRYMKLLTEMGYFIADDEVPRGYLLSDKAKKIFSPEQCMSPLGCVLGRHLDISHEKFEAQYMQTPSFVPGGDE